MQTASSTTAPASQPGLLVMSGSTARLGQARPWLVLALGVVAFLVILPFDGALHQLFYRDLQLHGDVAREMKTLQQYGQGVVIACTLLAIFLLDRPRRLRIFDYALAAGIALLAVNLIKVCAGRPRPGLHAPLGFVGPFGSFTRDGEALSPLFWSPHHSDLLGSTPSSHTAFAFLMSVFLVHLYPRVWPLVWPLAVIVAYARVQTGAHYVSDVVLGAALGAGIAMLICRKQLGVRLHLAIQARLQRTRPEGQGA